MDIKEKLIAYSKKKAVVEPVLVDGLEGLFVRYLDSAGLLEWDACETVFGKVALVLCDKEGVRIFGDTDLEAVSKLDRSIVKAAVEAGVKLNFPSVEEVEDRKN